MNVQPLMDWFSRAQRPMPWRSFPSPYWVWVSEAMLQQTQVVTVIPYFYRFVSQFPDIETLATADSQAVLKAWEGLGYYSRARNLHRAAKTMIQDFGGGVPSDYMTLQQLPGFGPYIAAAVASIAFEVPVPVVDGNVLRVFARFWGLADDIRSPKMRNLVFDGLMPIVATVRPSQFNQAIMELGALVCTPKGPSCGQCPLAEDCVALQTRRVAELPFKSSKPPVPHYMIGVGVVEKAGRLLIGRRRDDQMLGGLWEFPGGKQEPGESIEATIQREVREELGIDVNVGDCVAVVKHAYTHFKITLHAHRCRWVSGEPSPKSAEELRWVTLDDLDHYPFPKANVRVIEALKIQSGKLVVETA